jgi:hypothetical protein
MSEQRTLFKSARFLVTESLLRTPRKTYKLRDIDCVQVKRPFLLLSITLGALLIAWATVFHELLYPIEWFLLASGIAASVTAASRLGVLVVHSWSLRGGELENAIVWEVSTVRRIRAALDEAMHNAVEIRGNSNAGQGGRRHDHG